jgi:hypothetical protein
VADLSLDSGDGVEVAAKDVIVGDNGGDLAMVSSGGIRDSERTAARTVFSTSTPRLRRALTPAAPTTSTTGFACDRVGIKPSRTELAHTSAVKPTTASTSGS